MTISNKFRKNIHVYFTIYKIPNINDIILNPISLELHYNNNMKVIIMVNDDHNEQ